jgi:CBS domain-containing protein
MYEPVNVDMSDEIDPLSNYEPTEYGTELERALAEETVAAIQTKPFMKVHQSQMVYEAIEMLHGASVSSLLVVDDEDRLVGIFTERDVLERVAENFSKLTATRVSEVMTKNPSIVYETDPAAAAIAAIAIEGHRHVPVLSVDGQVMGVISPRRVCQFIERYY